MSNVKIMKRQFTSDMSYVELLGCYSMVDLKDIAKEWGIKGVSKLKKDELTENISNHISEELFSKFYMFNLDHVSIIIELSKGDNVCAIYPEAANELISLGLILEGNLNKEKQVIMPQLVLNGFKDFYGQYHETLTFNTIIKDYMDLTTALYGVLSVEQFVASFYEFNEKAIEKDVIESCVVYSASRTRNTVITDDLMHYYRLGEHEKVYKDIQTRDDVTYATIDHQMLQEFIANNHMIWSDTHDRLLHVMKTYFEGSLESTLDVIDELRVMLSYNHGISDFIQLFSKKHDNANMAGLKEFADVIVSLHTEMPHWELKGQSPMAMSKIKQMPIVKGDKIQRNDPCPCGSGKKYKKCCMN